MPLLEAFTNELDEYGMSSRKPKTRKRVAVTLPTARSSLEARSRLEEAERLLRAGQSNKAKKICEGLLRRYPDYVAALHTLGVILADMGDAKRAEPYLWQAAILNPKDWLTLAALGGVYLEMGATEMATHTLKRALELKPDEPTVLVNLGKVYTVEREYELAAELFRRAIKIDPSLYDGWTGLARAQMQLGELDEAANALEEVIKRGEYLIDYLYMLSRIPRSALTNVNMHSLIQGAVRDPRQTMQIFEATADFARATLYEGAGQHDEAWKHLTSANNILSPQHKGKYRKDMGQQRTFVARVKDSQVLRDKSKWVEGHPVSLFILGPSCSGKTSMERLVGSLDGVKRGYENPIVENSARRAFQTAALPTWDSLSSLPTPLDDLYRKLYFEELGERADSARVFTNTHPGRIYDAYRMAAILPNTRFIFVKRDINDISLRIFGKRYNSGNHYAYDLYTVRDHLEWYYRVIDILAQRMPGIYKIVWYEDMIANPAAALASAAEICGLARPTAPVVTPGDDRGCAEPYLELMNMRAAT